VFFRRRDLSEELRRERPIVIMARGHSGTRLSAQVLTMLGCAMGAGPEKPSWDILDQRFARTLRALSRSNLHLPPASRSSPDDLQCFQRDVHRFMTNLGDRSLGWGWKLPETYLLGNFVAASFPEARLVHMVRDGRDVAFKYHRTDRPEQHLGRRTLEHLGMRGQPHHVQAAASWAFQVERFLRFSKRWPHPIHTLSFEALLRDPEGEMEQLAAFAGRPMTDECRRMLQGQVNPAKIGEYRRHDPAQVAEIEARIGPTLRKVGYQVAERATGMTRLPVLSS